MDLAHPLHLARFGIEAHFLGLNCDSDYRHNSVREYLSKNHVAAFRKNRDAAHSGDTSQSLEGKGKRHLNLSIASYHLGHLSQSARAIVEVASDKDFSIIARALLGRRGGHLPGLWKLTVIRVLTDVIDGNVEARRIRQVEHIEGELQRNPLVDWGRLQEGDVRILLPGLTEDIALSASEVRLKRIHAWNAIGRAGSQ